MSKTLYLATNKLLKLLGIYKVGYSEDFDFKANAFNVSHPCPWYLVALIETVNAGTNESQMHRKLTHSLFGLSGEMFIFQSEDDAISNF